MVKEKPIYTYKQIQKEVEKAAKWINMQQYEQKPVMIGILNGCIRFYSDLMYYLDIDVDIDFLALSSYDSTKSSNNIKILKELKKTLKNRDVIVVEDIVDSGNSIKFIENYIKMQNPKSIKYVVLVTRKNKKSPINLDYTCLEIQDEFIVGYGFDAYEKHRNLNGIFEYINE